MSDLAYLSVRSIGKRFGTGAHALTAVDNMSFDVRQGSFVSILGPSGCGKSTLFNMMAGLLAPTAGDILLEGRSILCRPGHMGYMLQRDLLLPWRTIEDNIILGRTLSGADVRQARLDAARLMEKCGLSAFAKKRPDELSGGMRQRAALLRTLMTGREVLLLDEPFGALDAITRLQLQMMLMALWQETGKTILFVTHDVEEAILLADEVLVLTGRPGTVRERVPIALPRPRSPHMLAGAEAAALRTHLTDLLSQEVTDHA